MFASLNVTLAVQTLVVCRHLYGLPHGFFSTLPNRAVSSYVGIGIPGYRVGSRSVSILPLGSEEIKLSPGKEAVLAIHHGLGNTHAGREAELAGLVKHRKCGSIAASLLEGLVGIFQWCLR